MPLYLRLILIICCFSRISAAYAGGWVWEAKVNDIKYINDEIIITLSSVHTNVKRQEDFFNTGEPETFFGCDIAVITSRYNWFLPFYNNSYSKDSYLNAIQLIEEHYKSKKNLAVFYEGPMFNAKKDCSFRSNAIKTAGNGAVNFYYSE